MPAPRHNYDKTSAQRQRKRRAQFRLMRSALLAIEDALTLEEAQEIARAGLRDEEKPKLDVDE